MLMRYCHCVKTRLEQHCTRIVVLSALGDKSTRLAVDLRISNFHIVEYCKSCYCTVYNNALSIRHNGRYLTALFYVKN